MPLRRLPNKELVQVLLTALKGSKRLRRDLVNRQEAVGLDGEAIRPLCGTAAGMGQT